jgi:F420-0:gamma-glutamyl ligase-like protein
LIYLVFFGVLIVGWAAGRWRAHAEAAEALAHASAVVNVLTEALGECAEICDRYAADEAEKDTLEEPPNEAVVKEPWVQSIEAACVVLGAQDCAMLLARHIDKTHARLKEMRGR